MRPLQRAKTCLLHIEAERSLGLRGAVQPQASKPLPAPKAAPPLPGRCLKSLLCPLPGLKSSGAEQEVLQGLPSPTLSSPPSVQRVGGASRGRGLCLPALGRGTAGSTPDTSALQEPRPPRPERGLGRPDSLTFFVDGEGNVVHRLELHAGVGQHLKLHRSQRETLEACKAEEGSVMSGPLGNWGWRRAFLARLLPQGKAWQEASARGSLEALGSGAQFGARGFPAALSSPAGAWEGADHVPRGERGLFLPLSACRGQLPNALSIPPPKKKLSRFPLWESSGGGGTPWSGLCLAPRGSQEGSALGSTPVGREDPGEPLSQSGRTSLCTYISSAAPGWSPATPPARSPRR